MRTFDKTLQEYNEICRKLRTECEEFLTEVAKAWGNKRFPLMTIYQEFDFEDAYCSVVYDGGNHPEYASNACSEVHSVYLDKDGILSLSVEETDWYPNDRVDAVDVFSVAMAVDASIDYVLKELISLIGGECTVVNGEWTISRETWNNLVDLANGVDDLNRYLDDEGDDAEWLKDMADCYNPDGFVNLIKPVATITDTEVTWRWK